MAAQVTTATRPQARVSIKDKKRAYLDGFAAAILEERNMSHYSMDERAYAAGYDEGEAWRERNGM